MNGTARKGSWVVLNDGSVRGSVDIGTSKQTTQTTSSQTTSTTSNQTTLTLGQSSGPKGSNVTAEFTQANTGSSPPSTLPDVEPAIPSTLARSQNGQAVLIVSLGSQNGVLTQTSLTIQRVNCPPGGDQDPFTCD